MPQSFKKLFIGIEGMTQEIHTERKRLWEILHLTLPQDALTSTGGKRMHEIPLPEKMKQKEWYFLEKCIYYACGTNL